jgi:hypothetical protein
MRRHWSFGLGTASFGIGLNVLLAIIKHPPEFLYFVGWGLVAVGAVILLLNLIQMSKRRKPRQRYGDPRKQVQPAGPVGNIGYRGRPGSYGDLSEAEFSKDLGTAIENEGDVNASKARFGVGVNADASADED